ncbi:transposase [Sanguibacter antarcticus]|uniref:transposase n=1 Tax=Sanguibacter antarcticus TaxID=372484 RepID=UPI00117B37F3
MPSITSTEASSDQIATWVQGRWRIENRLHWVRDVVYEEDHSTVQTSNAPHAMATLRSTATSLLRLPGWTNTTAGLRHYVRHDQPVADFALPAWTVALPEPWHSEGKAPQFSYYSTFNRKTGRHAGHNASLTPYRPYYIVDALGHLALTCRIGGIDSNESFEDLLRGAGHRCQPRTCNGFGGQRHRLRCASQRLPGPVLEHRVQLVLFCCDSRGELCNDGDLLVPVSGNHGLHLQDQWIRGVPPGRRVHI